MIALRIVPLQWADPKSRKVLIPHESKPSYEWLGEEGDGFHSTRQAEISYLSASSLVWHSEYCKMVACDEGDILVNVAGSHDTFVALFAVWFPSDEDTFEETPLLALPSVTDDAQEPTYDPKTYKWSVGEWFEVTHFISTGDKQRGSGPFKVFRFDCFEIETKNPSVVGWCTAWYFREQIRPCPAPGTSFGDYDPALLDPFAIDTNPIHCPVCGAEMVMDYDAGELVCSADDCDARQPLTTSTGGIQ